MISLRLWESYTRKDVHDIFAPDTQSTPQAGSWGLRGIVAVPDFAGSYVFFVTFGRKQGDHAFAEETTDEFVFTWQSQPQQHFESKVIKKLLKHDDRVDTVYLFLRAQHEQPYLYPRNSRLSNP